MADTPRLKVVTEDRGDADVIDIINSAREYAVENHVCAIAVAVVDTDGEIETMWYAGPHHGLILAATTRMQHQINKEMDGEDTE